MAAQVGATDLFGPIGANTPGLAVARSASRVVADSGHDQHTVFLRRSRLSPLEQQVLPSARTVGRTEIDSHGGACYLPFVHLPTGGTVMIPALIDPLTGERRVVGRIHPDIVPVHDIVTPGVDTSASGPFGWLVSMWRTVMECVRIDRPSSHSCRLSTSTPGPSCIRHTHAPTVVV